MCVCGGGVCVLRVSVLKKYAFMWNGALWAFWQVSRYIRHMWHLTIFFKSLPQHHDLSHCNLLPAILLEAIHFLYLMSPTEKILTASKVFCYRSDIYYFSGCWISGSTFPLQMKGWYLVLFRSQLPFWCYAILIRTSYSFMDMLLSHAIHPTTYASPLKTPVQLLPSPQSFPDHIFEITISAFPSSSLFFSFLQCVSLLQGYNIPFTGLICL